MNRPGRPAEACRLTRAIQTDRQNSHVVCFRKPRRFGRALISNVKAPMACAILRREGYG